MNRNDALAWGIAVTLSLALHLGWLLHTGSRAGQERPSMATTTRVSFRSVAAPLTPPRDVPQQEEMKQTPPEVVEAPEPPPEPARKPKEKRAERVRQPKPPTQQPEKAPPSPPTTEVAEKQPEAQPAQTGSIADPALIERAKHEYLRRLMAHIDAHKRYPLAARRRGIEGTVQVSFTLQPGGGLGDLVISDGHTTLRKAVEEAMAAAQPLPPPPAGLALPMAISFRIVFSLKG